MFVNTALIALHEIDGAPLVLDTDLAKRLGYGRPEKIRELIQTHQMELLGYGGLPQIRVNPGPQGGRPTYAYYLNEEQALLICMFSGAVFAKEIRREIIQVYQAWRWLSGKRKGGAVEEAGKRGPRAVAYRAHPQKAPSMSAMVA